MLACFKLTFQGKKNVFTDVNGARNRDENLSLQFGARSAVEMQQQPVFGLNNVCSCGRFVSPLEKML